MNICNSDTTYKKLPPIFYSEIIPEPSEKSDIFIKNEALLKELELDAKIFDEGADYLTGTKFNRDSPPIAQAYAGHQFGHFNMLGDGRAALLGEHLTPDGKRVDIQLKGSGRTPYSRSGDGRAALGPMLREFIVSEAMHALNIPTTRALAVVETGLPVYRESVYPGAVLTRVASSHIRVGTFEYAAYIGGREAVRELADYTIDRHFPNLKDAKNRYLSLLEAVVELQAELVARWQSIGFIHGVLNSDNTSICGETIDFGPCAFMDNYNPDTVFSSIDIYGRYAFKNQPEMILWNLRKFAKTLVQIIDEDIAKSLYRADEVLSRFMEIFNSRYFNLMRKKLALTKERPEDEKLIITLLKEMEVKKLDYTKTLRNIYKELQDNSIGDLSKEWTELWRSRIDEENISFDEVEERVKRESPIVIARNHLVEEALLKAWRDRDQTPLIRLLSALRDPYRYNAEYADLYEPPKIIDTSYKTFCGT